MKRSEIIKKMSDCFNTCKIMGYTDKGAMDRVLELCEENGMLPPKYLTCKKTKAVDTLAVTEIDILNKNITLGPVYEQCEINEWEPENETESDTYCGAV